MGYLDHGLGAFSNAMERSNKHLEDPHNWDNMNLVSCMVRSWPGIFLTAF